MYGMVNEAIRSMVIELKGEECWVDIAKKIHAKWLQSGAYLKNIKLNDRAFYPHTAKGSAEILCNFFNQILLPKRSNA